MENDFDDDEVDPDTSNTADLMAGEAACAVPVGQKPPKFVRPARRGVQKPAKQPKRIATATVAERPPPLPVPDADGKIPMLNDGDPLVLDEQYTENERNLSDFLSLHPMLSLESTGTRALQLMANLVDETSVPTVDVEIIGKSHDDLMLRPPIVSSGERPCVLVDRCIARWIAIFRYGADSPNAFVCREYLTPRQLREFKEGGAEALPQRRGKCLLCTRYFLNYLYILARNDNSFRPSAQLSLNAFGNSVCLPCDVEKSATTASVVNDKDGYLPSAMLFVDEAFADTATARGPMGTLMWRPTVKFNSAHYVYSKDDNNVPRIIQVGVGIDDPLAKLHFQPPPPSTPTTEAAQ